MITLQNLILKKFQLFFLQKNFEIPLNYIIVWNPYN